MNKYIYTIDGRETAKAGLKSLSVITLIFTGAFIYFYLNYDDYSEFVRTIKHPNGINKGLAPTIVGWGYFVIPTFIIGILLMSVTRDFKQVSCGIDENEIFLNAEGIKATSYNLKEIKDIKESEHYVEIQFKDYSKLISNQFFLFRGIAKKKYITTEQYISLNKKDFEDEKGNEVFAFIKSKINKA